MVDLLVLDAQQRRQQNPALWPLGDDAGVRIEASLQHGLSDANPSVRELWLVAEVSEWLGGITHAVIVPAPPVYDVAASPGLFLDDCFSRPDAPPKTAETLLMATEAALRAAWAGNLIASYPAAGPWRSLYEHHGYAPVTLYMSKPGFSAHDVPPGMKSARTKDVAGIVRLSADHRRTLAQLNPRFWPSHPGADERFKAWMDRSLTLTDRDMMITDEAGDLHGYVIAQPVSRLQVPAAHDIGAIGVIDDFYDQAFADVPALSNNGVTAARLISAAESAFARRSIAVVLVVCPAAWTSKAALLELQGHRSAKLWSLKG